MSSNWYEEYLQKVRGFRGLCADALRGAILNGDFKIDTKPLSRSIKDLERHWKKQFPGRNLPHRDDMDRHLRFGESEDIIDLMTKDIHDSEAKAFTFISKSMPNTGDPYISELRINELNSMMGASKHDLSKLIRICEEVNLAAANKCFISVGILVRTILNHVPPIFGMKTFPEVANNYGGSSFKKIALRLESETRKIADEIAHSTIRKAETLPTLNQVDFRPSIDLLLGEIVSILREEMV